MVGRLSRSNTTAAPWWIPYWTAQTERCFACATTPQASCSLLTRLASPASLRSTSRTPLRDDSVPSRGPKAAVGSPTTTKTESSSRNLVESRAAKRPRSATPKSRRCRRTKFNCHLVSSQKVCDHTEKVKSKGLFLISGRKYTWTYGVNGGVSELKTPSGETHAFKSLNGLRPNASVVLYRQTPQIVDNEAAFVAILDDLGQLVSFETACGQHRVTLARDVFGRLAHVNSGRDGISITHNAHGKVSSLDMQPQSGFMRCFRSRRASPRVDFARTSPTKVR